MSKKLIEGTLLDAITATDDGSWVDVTSLQRMSVSIATFGVGTLHICGSIDPTKPADNTHGIQLGSDVTADTLYEITAKIKWLKVRCSAYTSGTFNAYYAGDSTAYGI